MLHIHHQSCASLQWLWIKDLLFSFLAIPEEAEDHQYATFKRHRPGPQESGKHHSRAGIQDPCDTTQQRAK